MNIEESQKQWEDSAYGWSKWEEYIDRWFDHPTEVMFDMAEVDSGDRVLDMACGAGTQSLRAARRVGTQGAVVACDFSETLLNHLQDNARLAGVDNITTVATAAEELDVAPEQFDAAFSRHALMLFVEPSQSLTAIKEALKPGGKLAAMVFTVPENNPFMAKPMQILLKHADKNPPGPDDPGIFALGAPGDLKKIFTESGFVNYEERTLTAQIQLSSVDEVLTMMQEAFAAYRAVINDCSEDVQKAAWNEVAEFLQRFETANGLNVSAEVRIGAAARGD